MVVYLLKSQGMKAKRPKQTGGGNGSKWWALHPEIDEFIRQTYPQHGCKSTCEQFGLSEGSVTARAFRLGVKRVGWQQSRSERIADTVRSVDWSFFEKWSPNLAWLVGYTWTDGTVYSKRTCHKVNYRCADRDEHIIHDIRKAVGSNSALYRVAGKSSSVIRGRTINASPQVGFTINSKRVCEWMIANGIPPNKSGRSDLPMPKVPDELFGHFVRGVIDGDGSIYRVNTHCSTYSIGVVICGQRRFIEDIRETMCSRYELSVRSISPNGSIFSIGWSSRQDVAAILAAIYPTGDYLHLRRKRDIAENYQAARFALRIPST